jgi:hypothetical protein
VINFITSIISCLKRAAVVGANNQNEVAIPINPVPTVLQKQSGAGVFSKDTGRRSQSQPTPAQRLTSGGRGFRHGEFNFQYFSKLTQLRYAPRLRICDTETIDPRLAATPGGIQPVLSQHQNAMTETVNKQHQNLALAAPAATSAGRRMAGRAQSFRRRSATLNNCPTKFLHVGKLFPDDGGLFYSRSERVGRRSALAGAKLEAVNSDQELGNRHRGYVWSAGLRPGALETQPFRAVPEAGVPSFAEVSDQAFHFNHPPAIIHHS